MQLAAYCQQSNLCKMIRIGIVCPSEIAFRRFMPALQKCEGLKYIGIAYSLPQEWFGDKIATVSPDDIEAMKVRELSKAQNFQNTYGGEIFEGYENIIKSEAIDAVYIPLPPALHYRWAKLALENGKHVFVEKPSTTCFAETSDLVEVARKHKLGIHENYMFIYHNQLEALQEVVKNETIGDVCLYRISFGFPMRASSDFRYNKALGGGALLDAGGYTIKYACYLLGETARMLCASKQYIDGFDVEMGGTATMINDKGVCAQLAFGMNNDYKCSIEIWGSKGTITSERILTAPEGFVPEYTLKQNQDYSTHKLPADDSFLKSMKVFKNCVEQEEVRKAEYEVLLTQERFIDEFQKLSE